MKKVYLETSIISYLVAKANRNIIILAQQEITKEWWEQCRFDFNLCISELVIEEAKKGDTTASEKRMCIIKDLSILTTSHEAIALAKAFLSTGGLPQKASVDALHIAIATVHCVDFLLTWNCTHIANAQIQKTLRQVAKCNQYDFPTICTPNELMGGRNYVER